ncbi:MULTISPECIES: S-methyl-5'-thioadenosine phosphorylase [Leptospira]|uniref:S-methyl-5'-thioadenosine phosphorylase n=2 Tax=Leptospira TaxID=171 RepID=A0A4R9GC72_9LEPT|nr:MULTISPECIES: S-methyl-5'-thioadenosine phosphorylase [Leptospira]PKA17739.1 S-methyl-5'-thioadenosine phosphorylase [Leptospira haakeii]PKA21464.1 S-methyl-5'-thioadenosine phosphorylase [Leptospira haakeii]TGK09313.1 S-methyl-5'-thioadenosine phosphorylase [Leptospira selangorensis]TGM16042.1 S-methyl-5'-thioadenosine phosphorylase [Leptospira selangorensis]TGM18007.1 S-methyl-5'-thioadenosine phosphorylase [Leptospira selangorensis]
MGTKVKAAVIGGTGLYSLDGMELVEEVLPETPWGKPSDTIKIGKIHDKLIAFLPRHGVGHFIMPHEVPMKANICALKILGVEEIVAFSSVGSLREEIKPLDFVLPSQIIDRTRGRESTFFGKGVVAHAPFADPFSQNLSDRINKAAAKVNLPIHQNKTLVCMEGPLFSTRAESHMYRSWGGDIINMSVLPEAKLAREAEIAYQMVCMSTDYDCWRENEEAVTAEMVMANLGKNAENAKKLLSALIPSLGNGDDLSLKNSTKYSIITAPERRNPDTVAKLKVLFPDYL